MWELQSLGIREVQEVLLSRPVATNIPGYFFQQFEGIKLELILTHFSSFLSRSL